MLRNNQQRARTARLVFLLLMLVSGGLILLSMVAHSLPDWEVDSSAASQTTTLVSLLYAVFLVGYFALLLASYVVLIRWMRRAYYNLHQLPGIQPEYSEGWAAGAWFVPFLNFVRPYTIMREVWQDTQLAAWGRLVEPTTLVGWWWAAVVLKMLLGRVTAKMGSNGSGITYDDLIAFMLDAGAQLVAAGFTWRLLYPTILVI